MKISTKLTTGICVRWTIATAKVVVLFGLLLFLLSFCSCSSSHPVMTETAATESMTSLESAKDSVGSNLELKTSGSQYLDISDLSIWFFPPVVDSPCDSVVTVPPEEPRPHTLLPAVICIGKLSAGSDSKVSLKESADSVGSSSADIKHDESTNDSEKRIRDPTSCRWPVLLVLGFALLMIIFTGYKLYRSGDS